MKKLAIIISLALFGIILSFSKSNAASCQLLGVLWGSQSAVLGQDVQVQVRGQGCKDYTASLNIYESDSLSDDFIKTVPVLFSNDLNATTNISFTQADYDKGGNESGNETMYVEAVAGEGAAQSKVDNKNTQLVLYPRSGNGDCQLGSASWKWNFRDQPIIGSPVHLIVSGTGCANKTAQLNLWEYDALPGRDDAGPTLSGTFNSQGSLDVTWKVDGSWDDDNVGSYQFYFIANVGGATVKSGILNNGSGIPLRSETGCLNCNAVTAPNPVQCSDGTSQPRGTFSNAGDACKDHIGDSLSDTPGSGSKYSCNSNGQCVPNPSGQFSDSTCSNTCTGTTNPTSSKSYSFTITNPLNGGPNDLLDVINIATRWLLEISIPLAVLLILYAGFLMLTAGPVPANFQKGKKILINVVVGLAVIFIGRGFITLIYSILELGGSNTAPPTTQGQ
jgi:hypothetical protein